MLGLGGGWAGIGVRVRLQGGVRAVRFGLSEELLELILVDARLARDTGAREHLHQLLHGKLTAPVLIDDAVTGSARKLNES